MLNSLWIFFSRWVANLQPVDWGIIVVTIPVMCILMASRKNKWAIVLAIFMAMYLTGFFGIRPAQDTFILHWTKS